ncbi:dihydrolipoyl dehydrogenase [Methylobacterium persicinum]|uniref:Dihydrolipoamide dehydrogenase n=1 Tax=Methylobacterium persicinum TaxID=374426 RepID=A0ABU0HNA1_9HYPH|nr:dihydrolipoyl dehydrogenase [Methylobacterium persicinum]MDQ0443810.1 dihydrolipoamide dehydrogenase [Methylobacterium persicinum]GJE37501.1 Dihydrolipoyl dehydrogenase [Methylobacterium persicinum]
MRERVCDVAVIGAGSAGLAAYRAAKKAGADCVLIERGPGGTTCARVGCMPSKLLIAAADVAQRAREGEPLGVRIGSVTVDGPAVLARLRRERDRFVGAVLDAADDFPAADRLAGEARFVDARTLAIGGEVHLRFGAAVIATGSSPAVPPPLRGLGDRLLTTDTLFEIPDLPESLAVLGLGAVGVELAQAMARLGVKVTAFDTGDTIAGLSEPDLVRKAVDIFSDAFTLHLGARVEGAERTAAGVRLAWTGADGRAASTEAACILAAAGRPPNLSGLGLDAAGLALDDRGMPDFDHRSLVCRGAPILIAGDANAWRPVLHEASRQGGIAGRNAAALAAGQEPERPGPWPSLAMVFTHPQAAAIGEPYDPDATGRIVGTMDFGDQGRARTERLNQGGICLWAAPDGRLLGGEMLGPGVEHLAQIVSNALCDNLTVQALVDRPVYHPTVEEGLYTALSEIIQKIDYVHGD